METDQPHRGVGVLSVESQLYQGLSALDSETKWGHLLHFERLVGLPRGNDGFFDCVDDNVLVD